MSKIDERVRQIEEFQARNFKVEKDLVELFRGKFEQFDEEILSAPYQEYTAENPPSYFPKDGLWA